MLGFISFACATDIFKLTWSQARGSCRAEGGDMLPASHPRTVTNHLIHMDPKQDAALILK